MASMVTEAMTPLMPGAGPPPMTIANLPRVEGAAMTHIPCGELKICEKAAGDSRAHGAAVDADRLAGDERRGGRAQPDRGVRHILGQAPDAQWRLAANPL